MMAWNYHSYNHLTRFIPFPYSMDRDIQFLFEIGALKHVKRFGNISGDAPMANVTEHTFRVVRIARMLAKNEEGCDVNKVIKMALIHDITESRTGDLNGFQRRYASRDEQKALTEMLANTSFSEDERALRQEAEAKETVEAKVMKDADYIDQRLEIHEKSHQGFSFTTDRKEIFMWMYDKLFTEGARTLRKQIEGANPFDRQTKIPNYHNS